jgi:myo-inositol 2-dehydrogenase/D-chiro-inositol 1-dehydrogenase
MVLRKLSLGLIGAGNMGQIHLSNCIRLKNAKLVAVADIAEKSLVAARKTGVKQLYKDYEELLKDKSVDAVIISLPTYLHAEAAVKAVEQGKHVFVEKPMTRDVVEAERIVSAVKANGVKLMVGYPMRFTTAFANLKKEVELGKLGHVQIAIANHISTGPFFNRVEESIPKPVPTWWFDKKLTGGGALVDLGCHMIDLLRWYFGEVTAIKCYLGHRFNMDFEDHATCTLKFRNGTVGVVNAGWFSTYHKVQVDLFGTANYVNAASKSPSLFDYAKSVLGLAISSTFYDELEYFVDCLFSDTQPEPSAEEGLEVQKLIERIYEDSISIGI